MSKSIFLMDTPACCGECPLSGTGACRKWSLENTHTFPKDCPLKKMPERKPDGPEVRYLPPTDRGYNICINEILKDTDV